MSQASKRRDALPAALPWRGMDREQAAAYIGISPSLFDEMVEDGRMPKPKLLNGRVVWDIRRLDLAFDALPEKDGSESTINFRA